jgi:hypothetical protein
LSLSKALFLPLDVFVSLIFTDFSTGYVSLEQAAKALKKL